MQDLILRPCVQQNTPTKLQPQYLTPYTWISQKSAWIRLEQHETHETIWIRMNSWNVMLNRWKPVETNANDRNRMKSIQNHGFHYFFWMYHISVEITKNHSGGTLRDMSVTSAGHRAGHCGTSAGHLRVTPHDFCRIPDEMWWIQRFLMFLHDFWWIERYYH